MRSEHQNASTDSHFPWELGIFDAHCHPTDTMNSIPEIAKMKATTLTIMATRGEDQDLVFETATSLLPTDNENGGEEPKQKQPQRIVPCFGWHPWFSYQLLDDIKEDHNNSAKGEDTATTTTTTILPTILKASHYRQVLIPSPTDPDFLSTLPPPKPLSQFIDETRKRLLTFPHALVGEIGLDRSFRLPTPWSGSEMENRDAQVTPGSREGRPLSPYKVQLAHQKMVLKAQLRLAGELHRAVSVHSVQAHGAVLEVLKELWAGHERRVMSKRERKREEEQAAQMGHIIDEGEGKPSLSSSFGSHVQQKSAPLPFPPRICMHSYSGPVEQLRLFLDPSVPADIYFSFSSVINLRGPSSRKVLDVIKALPEDRLLIESDLHTAGGQMDELLEDIARTVCDVRGWALEQGVRQLAENWKRFIFG